MNIVHTEREMLAGGNVKNNNWTTANEMIKLLTIAFSKKGLSEKGYVFLWKNMTATATGPDRIKGLLPAGTPVAHRTGTDSTVCNDAGIVTLPNGQHVAMAVFISDANVNPEACSRTIAQISRLVYDYYAH